MGVAIDSIWLKNKTLKKYYFGPKRVIFKLIFEEKSPKTVIKLIIDNNNGTSHNKNIRMQNRKPFFTFV